MASPRQAFERERAELDAAARVRERHRQEWVRWLGRWGVAGELMRVLTDPYTGRYQARPEMVRMALVAGVLTELVLAGLAGCDDGSEPGRGGSGGGGRRMSGAVRVTAMRGRDGVPVAAGLPDDAQCWVARRVLGAETLRSAHQWITELAQRRTRDDLVVGQRPPRPQRRPRLTRLGDGVELEFAIEELVARRLVAARVGQRAVEQQRWSRRKTVRLIAVAGYATGFLNAGHRIPRRMANHEPLVAEDVMIAALLDRVGLSRRIKRETTYNTIDLDPYLPTLTPTLRLLLRHASAAFGSTTSTGF